MHKGYFKIRTFRAAAALGGIMAVGAVALSGLPSDAGLKGLSARAEAAVPAAEPTLRLISQTEYTNTLSRIFGADIVVRIRFAPVNRVDGLLGVGASSAVLTSGGLDPLDATARSVADQVVNEEHRGYLIPCQPANSKAADERCAREFFAKVGRLLYRRPLTDGELGRVVGQAGRAIGPAGDFYAGLAYGLSGMLVSPQFLYIQERSEPDPNNPGAWRLDGYSKASRLAFLLWNAGPDEPLLEAAERGDLNKPAELRKQVDRMIASPLYQDGVRAFFTDFFVLEAFDNLAKDQTIYPAFSLKAVEEAREQILRTVVDHLVTQHGDYRDLFTTRRVMVSSELAVLYKLPVNVGSIGWVPYQFQQGDPRAGLLSQIGFLAQYAHPGRSSATRRGRGIREVLLCQKVPDPPGNVDFSNFENPKNPFKTARERLSVHQENPVCAGCHRVTDPIGLGLENFDGAGQFRATENDGKIDASGVLDGTNFSDAVGLGQAVRNHPALKSCIMNRLYGYSVGRKVTPAEEPLLEQYQATLDKRGYRFDDMLRLIILDPGFFAVRPQAADIPAPQKTALLGGSNAHQD
jgi:hypothetical protein